MLIKNINRYKFSPYIHPSQLNFMQVQGKFYIQTRQITSLQFHASTRRVNVTPTTPCQVYSRALLFSPAIDPTIRPSAEPSYAKSITTNCPSPTRLEVYGCHHQTFSFSFSTSQRKNQMLRTSILVHISSPVGRLMQCHIRFVVMWRRESEVIASRNNHPMSETTTSWDNFTTIV
jgi:hypothetical protein